MRSANLGEISRMLNDRFEHPIRYTIYGLAQSLLESATAVIVTEDSCLRVYIFEYRELLTREKLSWLRRRGIT